jgi:hypothetical protein
MIIQVIQPLHEMVLLLLQVVRVVVLVQHLIAQLLLLRMVQELQVKAMLVVV